MPININLPNIPNLPIAPLAVIHFGFTGLVLLYPLWLPQYAFVHLGLILMVLWAAHDKQSALAVIMYQICLFISFIVDIIGLGYYFRTFDALRTTAGYALWQFTAAMAIIHLLGKPLMGLYALVIVIARRGSLKFSPDQDSGYANIDNEGEGGR
jgi:hypothetical protein